ncbi:signal peptide protein [Strigomonas culicis]|uniref:Signal peptide protein n=1 Tax=Strigomonas culicis TaxID=28005 RepID=S9TNX9_9TRYP|nr:signal peptide protein [Strigomonas culicis]|eukprot:EPY18409.1 signal peptide protein [Strigomonas culicis]
MKPPNRVFFASHLLLLLWLCSSSIAAASLRHPDTVHPNSFSADDAPGAAEGTSNLLVQLPIIFSAVGTVLLLGLLLFFLIACDRRGRPFGTRVRLWVAAVRRCCPCGRPTGAALVHSPAHTDHTEQQQQQQHHCGPTQTSQSGGTGPLPAPSSGPHGCPRSTLDETNFVLEQTKAPLDYVKSPLDHPKSTLDGTPSVFETVVSPLLNSPPALDATMSLLNSDPSATKGYAKDCTSVVSIYSVFSDGSSEGSEGSSSEESTSDSNLATDGSQPGSPMSNASGKTDRQLMMRVRVYHAGSDSDGDSAESRTSHKSKGSHKVTSILVRRQVARPAAGGDLSQLLLQTTSNVTAGHPSPIASLRGISCMLDDATSTGSSGSVTVWRLHRPHPYGSAADLSMTDASLHQRLTPRHTTSNVSWYAPGRAASPEQQPKEGGVQTQLSFHGGRSRRDHAGIPSPPSQQLSLAHTLSNVSSSPRGRGGSQEQHNAKESGGASARLSLHGGRSRLERSADYTLIPPPPPPLQPFALPHILPQQQQQGDATQREIKSNLLTTTTTTTSSSSDNHTTPNHKNNTNSIRKADSKTGDNSKNNNHNNNSKNSINTGGKAPPVSDPPLSPSPHGTGLQMNKNIS